MMSEENKRKGKQRIMLIVVFALLIISLIFNGLFIKWNAETEGKVEKGTQSIDSLMELQFKISNELLKTTQDLENYKGITTNLDSMLLVANTKIESQKQRINNLFSQNLSQKKLKEKLEIELAELRSFRNEYLDKVDSLILINKTLQASNIKLKESIQISESEREVLAGKVTIASKLKIENLVVTAFKKKRSGKLVETALAKKTKIIKVCLDVEENLIAEKKKTDIHLKLTGPEGVVLYLERFGSGVFKTTEDKDSKFTMLRTIDYDQTKQNVCFNWQQDVSFSSGSYQVEIYINRTLSGLTSFDLK